MFVRISCNKFKFRNQNFILSRFFVQDDQGWQGRGSLALCENVRLPVEAGRGQVSTYPLLLVPDRKLGLELLGHGFYGIPAGGHLPKPLHELLPNSWKLVPCQLQMTNKHFFPQDKNSPATPVQFILYKKSGKYKMPVPKLSSLISHTIF